MRILMVLPMPAVRTLGGARIQVDLAEALREKGHEVDFLSSTEVYGDKSRSKLQTVTRSFARAARPELRRRARDYDVIDALEACVTASKPELGFHGVLVARSLGLIDAYERWRRAAVRHSPELRGKLLGRVPRTLERRRHIFEGHQSRRRADGFFVPNAAERDELAAQLGRQRVCHLPFALRDSHRHLLAEAAAQRGADAEPRIVFLGTWALRKGKRDMSTIVQTVRAAEPNASFLFLGTHADSPQVLADLGLEPCPWIEVKPTFKPDDLPEILASATVGVFPSYVEGFPFAVLEQLAAGIPVAAYDVPGPQDSLSELDRRLLAKPGDSRGIASILVDSIREPIVSAEACIARAADFSWDQIADRTLEAYTAWSRTLGREA